MLYLLDTFKSHKMKKILLSAFAIIAFAFNGTAQAPDLMFENWANVPLSSTNQDPVGWASLNALNIVGTAVSVYKETIAPNQGLISAEIRTVDVNGASIPNPYTTGNIDTAGILVMGTINISPPGLTYGKPMSGRPATLAFTCKYSPMPGDSAFVLAYLTRYFAGSRDTIAWGKYETGATTTTFAANSLTMNYDPAFSTVWADTMLVFASSSVYSHPGAKIGSTFYIDAMSWSGYNSINEAAQPSSISIFPNPATNNISFTSKVNADAVEVLDIIGRRVGVYTMIGNALTIETSSFSSGMYIYNVLNEKKEVVNRGKFEVTK